MNQKKNKEFMEIKDVKVINKDSKIAKFSLATNIDGYKGIIRECVLFKKGQNRWINVPTRTYEEDGKTKYFPYIRWDDDETQKRFNSEVIKLYDDWVKTNSSPQTEISALPPKDGIPF